MSLSEKGKNLFPKRSRFFVLEQTAFQKGLCMHKSKLEVINPFMPSGLFCLNSSDRSISYLRGVVVSFLSLSFFVEISELHVNSVEPDQTPHSAASDLGLHCLPMSLLWDAWV